MLFTKFWKDLVKTINGRSCDAVFDIEALKRRVAALEAQSTTGHTPDPKKDARNAKRREQRAEAKRQKELAQFAAKAKRKR